METFTKKNKSFVLLSILTLFALMLSPFGGLLSAVHAANVVAYIDLTDQNATAPSTVAAAPEVAVSTADEFSYAYVASTSQFANTNTISIYIPAGFASVANCSSATTDADGDSTPDGAAVITGSVGAGWTVTYTFTAATTAATTTGVEICFAATTPATVGNYSVAHTDTNDTDVSAALIYVGDDNDVLVTATVPATLSLRIKEASTTTDTNACALGVLNPASVNSCSYRIAAGTNFSTGLEVYVLADNQLNTAGDTADIDDAAGGSQITAGTEAHGVRVTLGTGFTVGGSFSTTNDQPVPLTQTLILDATAPVDDSNTATWNTITHRASVDTASTGGAYDQIVTYRAFVQT